MLCLLKGLAQLIPNVSVLLISPDTDVLILALHFVAIPVALYEEFRIRIPSQILLNFKIFPLK